MRVLVSGSTGFIGTRLVQGLAGRGHEVIAVVRRGAGERPPPAGAADVCTIADLARTPDWHSCMRGVDAVVHLAARVHVMRETARDPLQAFREVNVEGTRSLAAAADAGVARFVYLSSIKVNGEETGSAPFRSDDEPAPRDAYGVSKLEAERALRRVCADSAMTHSIIRPPLVYGAGVKGNFARLVRWVDRGLPLPFGAVANRRSMVSLDNLVSLILVCLQHPAAADRVFLAGDGDDWSTPELVRRIAHHLDRPCRLVAVPPGWLTGVAGLLGRADAVRRLTGSLRVDIGSNRELLGWMPPQAADDGVRAAVAGYREARPG